MDYNVIGEIMLFDVHCHILPGVDDGAKTEDSTKRMLKFAAREGMNSIIATPHFKYGEDFVSPEDIYAKYQMVRAWWKQISPKKELYLGSELFYSESIIEALKKGYALTINGTKYVLIEFPIYAEYGYIERAVKKLLYAGYIPILAHMERYKSLRKREQVQQLVDMGAYMQVNTSAIMGKHGILTKWYLLKLIKSGLIHFIGTDAHGSRERRPEIRECVEYLRKKIGNKETRRIVEKNPQKMLRGEKLV